MNIPTPDFNPVRYHHVEITRPDHLMMIRNMLVLLLWSELKKKGLGKMRMSEPIRRMHYDTWWSTNVTTVSLNNLFTAWSATVTPPLNDLHQLYSKVCLAHSLLTQRALLPKTLGLSLDSSDCFLLLHAVNDEALMAKGFCLPDAPPLAALLRVMQILGAYTDPKPHLPNNVYLNRFGLTVTISTPLASGLLSHTDAQNLTMPKFKAEPEDQTEPPHDDDDQGWSRSLAA